MRKSQTCHKAIPYKYFFFIIKTDTTFHYKNCNNVPCQSFLSFDNKFDQVYLFNRPRVSRAVQQTEWRTGKTVGARTKYGTANQGILNPEGPKNCQELQKDGILGSGIPQNSTPSPPSFKPIFTVAQTLVGPWSQHHPLWTSGII